jgi:hypothetical protein
MTSMLKRGLLTACLTVVALSIPTPALAATSGTLTSGAGRARAAGICEFVPMFWWCSK